MDQHMNKPYGYLIDSTVLYLPSQQQLNQQPWKCLPAEAYDERAAQLPDAAC